MNNCIICNGDSGFGMICNSCKEAFMHYKNLYFTKKLITETTELDDEVFEQIYKSANVRQMIEDEVNSIFTTDANMIADSMKEALKDTLSKDTWLNAQEGRFDNFLKFIDQRIHKDYEEIINQGTENN